MGLPFDPGLAPLGRRIPAAVPKLTRRVANGVTGVVREAEESSSSITFSSKSELLVDRLARRFKVALVGEVPDRPTWVERESLRCWLTAVAMAPGYTGVPAMELLRWKMLTRGMVTEPRRLRCMSVGGGEGGLL